jgi:succinyl-diaminopimelate desuccinylase
MDVELVEMSAGRTSLIARAGSRFSSPITLSGHLDTVPTSAAHWSGDPRAGRLIDGRMIGCGASDMKAGVAALVVALERHMHSGSHPGSILLLLTAGEETGCAGARHVVQSLSLPTGGPLLVAEPTANRLVPGHKGTLWLELTARGRAAHGSRPELGINAITALARVAVQLADNGLPGEHPVMGPVTVNVGTISGGTQINLVPDLASMTVDVRLVPGARAPELVSTIRALAGRTVNVRTLLELPAVYTPPDSPFASMMVDAVTASGGSAVWSAPVAYFTDASVLAPALGDAEVVLLGPGEPELAHTVGESCSVARIAEAVDIYEHALRLWRDGQEHE